MISRLSKKDCVGCGSCASTCPLGCISMRRDGEGFLYPYVKTVRCIECDMCERACPVISTSTVPLVSMPTAYIAWAHDEIDLLAGTSGGVFTALARQFLDVGGVVVGAAYDSAQVVRHVVVSDAKELYQISRSKYVQSDTHKVFSQLADLLSVKRPVLFSGTPCQVYAVKAFCKANMIDESQLLCVDIVCQSVPSPKLLAEYVGWQEQRYGAKLVELRMRQKASRTGFSTDYVTQAVFADGTLFEADAHDDYYGRCFFGRIASRPSCHNCSFKTVGRISDLTLGDCWFSRDLSNRDDVPFDVTLCFAHTEGGRSLLADCPVISVVPVDSLQAVTCNGGMIYHSVDAHPKRSEFFLRLGDEPLGDLVTRYFPNTTTGSLVTSIKASIKNAIPHLARLRIVRNQKREFLRRVARVVPEEALRTRMVTPIEKVSKHV